MSYSGEHASNLLVQSWPSYSGQATGSQHTLNAVPGFPGLGAMQMRVGGLHADQPLAHAHGSMGEGHAGAGHQEAVEDDAEDIQYNLRPRSTRSRNKVEAQGEEEEGSSDSDEYDSDKMGGPPDSPRKGKRKVGRPIIDRVPIDSPHLTEAERRRMKRRVDNRESARRVRNKRQSYLQEISNKISAMKASNASLKAQIAKDQTQSRKMVADISEARTLFAKASEEGARLRIEVNMLQSHLRGAPMDALPLQQPPGPHPQTGNPTLFMSLSRLNTLSLPGAASLSLSLFASRELPSLQQLTSQPSKELPFSEFVQMHRQNSQRPLPDLGGLGEIQGLTGLEPLAALGAQETVDRQPGRCHSRRVSTQMPGDALNSTGAVFGPQNP